jgi:hypothetical protein
MIYNVNMETKNDLTKVRKIITLIVNILENKVNNYDDDSNTKFIKFIIGGKENMVSTVSKLTNLLIKIIPLEEKFNDKEEVGKNLSNDDMKIVLNYIKKREKS